MYVITIIDYQAGNLTSVRRALEYLGLPCRVSADPEQVLTAERVIFPGVGHAASAMQVLRQGGLDEALKTVYTRGTPILGICLGAQIILSHSDEGNTPLPGVDRWQLPSLFARRSHAESPSHGLERGTGYPAPFYFERPASQVTNFTLSTPIILSR